MPVGLNVNRLINVSVNLSPSAAQAANFSSLLIMGNSDVIDTYQRLRSYNSLSAVAADFGTSVPEYLAASAFFGQTPSPAQLYIGRWAQTATSGRLLCGVLNPAQQLASAWTSVASGGFKIAVDAGSVTSVTGLNFSSVTNMNGVASVINTGLAAATLGVTCTWSAANSQFLFESNSTGTASQISFLTSPASGTDISAQLMGTAATASYRVTGIAAESAVTAVSIMDALPTQFYGLMFASASIVDADHLAIAAYIEGDGNTNAHLYGLTTNETSALSSTDNASIGYQLKQLGYNRTCYQYSSSNLYAVASLLGRILTTNFQGNNTTITLMYKQEPGVTPELLTASQSSALDSNNYNYFATYTNATSIIVNGKVASGQYIDTIVGTDVLANQIQTNLYNVLYQSQTKVPQTDQGIHQLVTAAQATCAAFVANGFLAPGVWTVGGFGTLNTGDLLSKGYYVYAPPIASQSSASRAARAAPPLQIAAKLAGAVHTASVIINVNQ
jgi:hypothetical protein